jgi:hypothetical protein
MIIMPILLMLMLMLMLMLILDPRSGVTQCAVAHVRAWVS